MCVCECEHVFVVLDEKDKEAAAKTTYDTPFPQKWDSWPPGNKELVKDEKLRALILKVWSADQGLQVSISSKRIEMENTALHLRPTETKFAC